MKTPFPHFGAKHRVAAEIWERFGDPSYYYEPFGGTLGTLLGRPEEAIRNRYEYVGDTDAQITNFFRTAKFANPNELAHLADWPPTQLDLEARAAWLKAQRSRLVRELKSNPNWYDLECAAWFVWVQSVKISRNGSFLVLRRNTGVRRRNQDLTAYFAALANRLKDVTIHFGDWVKLANAAEPRWRVERQMWPYCWTLRTSTPQVGRRIYMPVTQATWLGMSSVGLSPEQILVHA